MFTGKLPGLSGGQIEGFYNAFQPVAGMRPDGSTPANTWFGIVPKGTGGLLGNIPDNTSQGGAIRGVYSIDFQLERGSASEVASGGRSSITGGSGNTASGNYSKIGGGRDNVGSATYSAILGGQGNTASGTHSTIGGGNSNLSSSIYTTIGGGFNNEASNNYATVAGGQSNDATANHTFIGGGQVNQAIGAYSAVVGGTRSYSYLYGQQAHANGQFNSIGDAQASELVSRLEADQASASTGQLFLDGSSASLEPNGSNRAWNVTAKFVATVESITGTATAVTVGDTFASTDHFLFTKIAGVSAISAITNAFAANVGGGGMATATVSYTVGATDLAVNLTWPTFAGGGTLNIRAVCTFELSEVAF